VRAANPAGLDSAMRRFADAKACEHVIHYHGAGLEAARQSFTALAVVDKDAGRQTSAYFSAY
jgi:hypothetical protein